MSRIVITKATPIGSIGAMIKRLGVVDVDITHNPEDDDDGARWWVQVAGDGIRYHANAFGQEFEEALAAALVGLSEKERYRKRKPA